MNSERRHSIPWLHLFLIALVIGALWSILSHNPHAHRRAKQDWGHRLTIITYNTHRMGMFRKPADNEVLQFLRNTEADIICLQEVEVYKDNRYLTLPELKQAMSRWEYTYFDFKVYNSRRQFGNVVFSHYPLINKKTVPFESKGSISSRCDVVVDADTIRLIVNHLESYRLDRSLLQVDSLFSATPDRREQLRERFRRTGPTRREQAHAVKDEVDASPYPVILTGDFNVPPLSRTYYILKRGLRDCFLETSFLRYGTTYPLNGGSDNDTGSTDEDDKGSSLNLGVRIDYIFCSQSLTPLTSEVITTDASDHYPLCCTIGY